MLLRYSLGLETEARAVEEAIGEALASGIRTADIAEGATKKVGTREMADRISSLVASR